jgi:hypothetical protein
VLSNRDSRLEYREGKPCIENLSVSYLEEGDRFDPSTNKIKPASGKEPLKGKEKSGRTSHTGAGSLSAEQVTFYDLLTRQLADNKANDTVKDLTMFSSDEGYLITLRKTAASEAWAGERKDNHDQYTIVNFAMDIAPVHLTIEPFNK